MGDARRAPGLGAACMCRRPCAAPVCLYTLWGSDGKRNWPGAEEPAGGCVTMGPRGWLRLWQAGLESAVLYLWGCLMSATVSDGKVLGLGVQLSTH